MESAELEQHLSNTWDWLEPEYNPRTAEAKIARHNTGIRAFTGKVSVPVPLVSAKWAKDPGNVPMPIQMPEYYSTLFKNPLEEKEYDIALRNLVPLITRRLAPTENVVNDLWDLYCLSESAPTVCVIEAVAILRQILRIHGSEPFRNLFARRTKDVGKVPNRRSSVREPADKRDELGELGTGFLAALEQARKFWNEVRIPVEPMDQDNGDLDENVEDLEKRKDTNDGVGTTVTPKYEDKYAKGSAIVRFIAELLSVDHALYHDFLRETIIDRIFGFSLSGDQLPSNRSRLNIKADSVKRDKVANAFVSWIKAVGSEILAPQDVMAHQSADDVQDLIEQICLAAYRGKSWDVTEFAEMLHDGIRSLPLPAQFDFVRGVRSTTFRLDLADQMLRANLYFPSTVSVRSESVSVRFTPKKMINVLLKGVPISPDGLESAAFAVLLYGLLLAGIIESGNAGELDASMVEEWVAAVRSEVQGKKGKSESGFTELSEALEVVNAYGSLIRFAKDAVEG
ncbi:hypothetical protein BJ742DRAFT_481013 [Cladochytrium replicatum]|nr:hypothetical protein BJ742DRAFT_481013 [Cladochytrium replicatum]